ncbi:hypothetical protein D3C86_2046340 [compost metagenome]
MVLIYMKVADSFYFKIDATMTGNLIQHVIKEVQSGMNISFTNTIKINMDTDFGFIGITLMRYYATSST